MGRQTDDDYAPAARWPSDAGTKAQYIGFVSGKIGGPAPTAKDEEADPVKCDAYYERCGNWLRENTRDTKKFKLLFDENINYGYRRNLLGLKAPGLAIDALVLAACGNGVLALAAI